MVIKVAPYHSELQDVYHDKDNCVDGNNIEKKYLRQGTGGKRLCNRCSNM